MMCSRKRLAASILALGALFGLLLPPADSGESERRLTAGFVYRPALPGRTMSFPADHYAHPDFKTEWWYYTGHLEAEGGGRYGYQVTFFRFGIRDRQAGLREPPLFTELYMAHIALSDLAENKFLYRERINRGYGGKAGAAADRYLVWNEDWRAEGDAETHRIEVGDARFALRLTLRSLKPPALHGEDGHSRKGEGEGRASYYYSLTRMETAGELMLAGRREKVRGASWMDHEFGSNQLRADQIGWDWFSIQLDDGRELMLYQIRRRDGSVDPYSSGTLVAADGATRHLALRDFHIEVARRWKSSESGATYPVQWRVAVPSEGIDIDILPAFPEQELITNRSTRVTYWEGAVAVRARTGSRAIAGRGYVEMTGYAGKVSI